MCITCGCSKGAEITVTEPSTAEIDREQKHSHTLPDGTTLVHSHPHHSDKQNPEPSHSHPHTYDEQNPDPSHRPFPVAIQLTTKVHRTTLTLEQNLLAKNDQIAAQNRDWFKKQKILALNLVSSPGSGKTTLLTRTIRDLQHSIVISVIEGDQATVNDATRIQETGCQAIQINTGTGCHLEAAMVKHGLTELNPLPNSIVMIENVGNLVCPALFDLGEFAKVAILSVTEGEDKPIKYPHMFRASQVMILNKIDLLPYLSFDVNRCLEYAYQVNPHLQIFQVSATTGVGLRDWYTWLENAISREN